MKAYYNITVDLRRDSSGQKLNQFQRILILITNTILTSQRFDVKPILLKQVY